MTFLVDSRQRVPEIMDRPDLDPQQHRAALRGLARLNAWSGSARILWPAIERLARGRKGPLRLLDLATGCGDVPIRVALRARLRGMHLAITGLDRSPLALDEARDRARRHGLEAEFRQHDVVADDLPAARHDVVTCSLFLHHLSEGEVVTVLTRARQAASAMVVCDLDRRPAGLALTWLATRLLTRSSVVHFDGLASVRAAFTPVEMAGLAARAGLAGAVVTRRWPFRWLLEWGAPAC